MYERENVLRIFEETKQAITKGDVAHIRNLSNQTTNSASYAQDPDNIAAAVVVYSLSKILEREDYRRLPGWNKFYGVYIGSIDRIIGALKRKDDVSYRKEISIIRFAIGNLSGKLKGYIQDVFRQASINKASRLYDHGVSMERTANLLGITMYELAEYAGEKQGTDIQNSNVNDGEYSEKSVSVRDRIKFAMDMFP